MFWSSGLLNLSTTNVAYELSDFKYLKNKDLLFSSSFSVRFSKFYTLHFFKCLIYLPIFFLEYTT